MQRLLVINGPNLNLLGTRTPEVYGSTTLAELEEQATAWGADLGVAISTYQSNHEGALLDRIHQAGDEVDGIVINPGALTHYSYALHDALEAVGIPAVEVHISNVKAREEWRRHSVVGPACVATIYGRGIAGYKHAIRHLVERAAWPFQTIPYGEGVEQVGDLRLPEQDGPHPVAVILHGGFWADVWARDLMDAIAVDLALEGWATWNIEYHRVGAGGGWPRTLDDVALGVDALLNLAADHPLDLSRVVLVGHSAGGQLALWAAARSHLETTAPGSMPMVQPAAVAALAAVSDLAEAHRLSLDDGAVERFLRRSPEEASGRYAVASPMALVPLHVRQLIVHGDADEHVPVEMSRAYTGAAADAGDSVVYHELESIGHFELIEPKSDAWSKIRQELDQLV